jgi:hypothetical protein
MYEVSGDGKDNVHWVDWGLKMKRMTEASVGADPWTVVQNKLNPTVAEAEFTPLDLSCLNIHRPDDSPNRSTVRKIS